MIQKCLFCCMASSFLCISIVIAQGTATYELTFTATWSATTHPTNFPPNPHFSGMIGGTHNSAVSFWSSGSNASEGIKQMAELGAKGALRNEINQAIGASNADAIVDASGLNSPGVQTTTFEIRPPWNLVTVTSMMAPSPDWFVGVSGLDLLDANGDWINSLEVDLFVYDAGTDSGPNYTSPNQPTNPREAIERITVSPFLVDGSVKSVGTFRFELISIVGNTPRVSLSVDQNPVDEGESITVTVELSDALNTDVTIPLTLTSGTAESGDYDSTTPVNLDIDNGDTKGTYVIQTYKDDDIEDETFTVALDTNNLPSEVVAGSPTSEEVTIRDIDMPEVSLSVDQNAVDEGESITVTVQLSDALNTDVTIPLTLTSGTAESGDYDSTTPVSLDIDGGDTEAEYVIKTYKDDDVEDETFTVELDTNNLPSEVRAGSPTSEEVTIRDLDVPEVSLSIDQNPVDEGESVTVTVLLSNALSTDVTIPLMLTSGTAEPDDYDSTTPVNLNISSGNTEAMHGIQTYKDDDVENETFTVELDTSNLPSGVVAVSPISEEVTIRDLDMPGVSLSIDQNPVDEGELITVTVQLSNALNTDITIPLMLTSGTAEPDDYDSTTPVNLNISSGNTEAMHGIQTYKDDDVENETFTVELDTSNLPSGVVAGSPISEEVTITDLDMPGISTPTSVEFMEGDTTSISVALTAQPSSDVTVTITGHENTDLTLDMNVLTFTTSNWDQEQTVTLTAAEDTDLLNDEVTLTLSTAGGGYVASQTMTVTITDNMGVATEQTEESVSLALWGNYPNPLSNTTKIAFDLPAPAIISVTITDLLGRTVKMLPYGSFGVGRGHTVEIDAEGLPSGVYYYTLKVVMDDQVVKRSKAMSVVR